MVSQTALNRAVAHAERTIGRLLTDGEKADLDNAWVLEAMKKDSFGNHKAKKLVKLFVAQNISSSEQI